MFEEYAKTLLFFLLLNTTVVVGARVGAPDQRQGSAITIYVYFPNPLFKYLAIHSLWLKISILFSLETAYCLLSWTSFITTNWSPALLQILFANEKPRESHVRSWFCPRFSALTPALCLPNWAHNLSGLEINYIDLYTCSMGLRTDSARDPYDIYVLSAETYDCRTIALRFCMRTSTNGRSKNRTMPV